MRVCYQCWHIAHLTKVRFIFTNLGLLEKISQRFTEESLLIPLTQCRYYNLKKSFLMQ